MKNCLTYNWDLCHAGSVHIVGALLASGYNPAIEEGSKILRANRRSDKLPHSREVAGVPTNVNTTCRAFCFWPVTFIEVKKQGQEAFKEFASKIASDRGKSLKPINSNDILTDVTSYGEAVQVTAEGDVFYQ